jgi:DNA-binding CsgD family transcriptional regulator
MNEPATTAPGWSLIQRLSQEEPSPRSEPLADDGMPLDHRDALNHRAPAVRIMGATIAYLTAAISTRAAVFHTVDGRGAIARPVVFRLSDKGCAGTPDDLLAAAETGYRDLSPFSLSRPRSPNITMLGAENLGGPEEFARTRYATEVLAPLGFASQTALLLRQELRLVGVVSLFRGFGQPPLTRAQRTLMLLSRELIEEAFVFCGGTSLPAAADSPLRRHDLTEREIEVARFAAIGATNREIARRLQLSPATIKTHLNRAYMKLGIRSRTQLSVMIASAGQ